MTDIAARLADIKARVAKASKGPWTYDSYNTITEGERRCILQITDHPSDGEFGNDGAGIKERSAWYAESASNAVFAASAREDIPWLIRQLEAAWERHFNDCMAAKKSGYDDGIAFGLAERDRLAEENERLRGAFPALGHNDGARGDGVL